MTKENNFMVSYDLMPALGYALKGPLTTISPLHYPDTPEMEKMMPFLADQGLIGSDGRLKPDIQATSGKLARAETFTRIFLTSRFGLLEFINYFTPEGSWVSLSRSGESVQVEDPGKIDEMVEAVRQQIGESLFVSNSFHASLSPADALVLGALWDLTRKANLRAISEEKEADLSGWPVSAISSQASEKDQKYQWMTNVIRLWTENQEGLPESEIKKSLDALVAGDYCSEQGGSYALKGDAFEFARNMLLFSNILTLTAGIEGPGGKVAVVGFSCIQSGIHDLLMIDFQKGRLKLDMVSAAEVMEYVDAFMRKPLELLRLITPKPEVVKETAPALSPGVPGVAPAPEPAFSPAAPGAAPAACPKCGHPVTPGSKFCGRCGAPLVVSQPVSEVVKDLSTCPRCGTPVVPGKKFCGTCGTPLTVPSPRPGAPVCPNCGHPATSGKKFCGNCGAKLEG
jgi:hypothetical protein